MSDLELMHRPKKGCKHGRRKNGKCPPKRKHRKHRRR